MREKPKLTTRQRDILAIIGGHPEAIDIPIVLELEAMGLVTGEGTELRITGSGQAILSDLFHDETGPADSQRAPTWTH